MIHSQHAPTRRQDGQGSMGQGPLKSLLLLLPIQPGYRFPWDIPVVIAALSLTSLLIAGKCGRNVARLAGRPRSDSARNAMKRAWGDVARGAAYFLACFLFILGTSKSSHMPPDDVVKLFVNVETGTLGGFCTLSALMNSVFPPAVLAITLLSVREESRVDHERYETIVKQYANRE